MVMEKQTEKIEPCAFCGQEPMKFNDTTRSFVAVYFCGFKNCLGLSVDRMPLDAWNTTQRDFRARDEKLQREAFEAARETASGFAAAASGEINFWYDDFNEYLNRS